MANLTNFILAGIVVSILAAGIFTFVTDVGGAYGFTAPSQINSTYNQLAEYESSSSNLTSVFRTGDLSEAIGFFPKGVINTIMLIPNLIKTMTVMMAQAVFDLDLPSWLFVSGLMIVTLLVVMAVVSLLARWQS